MASFASVSDLKTYLRRSDLANNDAGLTQALAFATAAIKAYTNQTIEAGTSTITLNGNGSDLLLLPELPVNTITSVTIVDPAGNIDDEILTTGRDYRLLADAGILKREGGYIWEKSNQTIEVAYTHGYETIPDPIKLVCTSLAARFYDNPTAEATESLGGYSVTHSFQGSPHQFHPGEKAILDRYRVLAP